MNKVSTHLLSRLLFASVLILLSVSSVKAETPDCLEITSIPVVITTQGIHCFKQNLANGATSGNMIDIQTNNVTIDMNGFKLGGLEGGTGTLATGIYANSRRNITIRNGSIRGFYYGILLEGGVADSSGHLLEDLRLDGITFTGALIEGTGNIVRNNQVVNTGPGTNVSGAVGLYIKNSNDSVVVGNVISAVSESTASHGIYVQSSSLIVVRNNTVLRTKDASSKYGITVYYATDMTIVGNQFLNPGTTGSTGIFNRGNSTEISCIDNIIKGYVTTVSGCDDDIDNNKL